jgi:outer membrane murein-binding lipoprotein Lpp
VVVLFVWIGAVVLAGVVVAFCAYELTWKSKRLSADLAKLEQLSGVLTDLQDEVSAVQLRMIEARR